MSAHDTIGWLIFGAIMAAYAALMVIVVLKHWPRQTPSDKDPEDYCGLCGHPGADKFAHPEHWPGEQVPDGPLVHAECERLECERAFSALTPAQRSQFLRNLQ